MVGGVAVALALGTNAACTTAAVGALGWALFLPTEDLARLHHHGWGWG